MSAITIKNVPPPVIEQLRERAKMERRSLTQEALVLLEAALAIPMGDIPSGGSQTQAQVTAWQRLAGRWRSDTTAVAEIEGIYAARTKGRKVDL